MEAAADEDGVVLPVHRVGGWPRSGFSDLGNHEAQCAGYWVPQPRRVFVFAASGSLTTGLRRWGELGWETMNSTSRLASFLPKSLCFYAEPFGRGCVHNSARLQRRQRLGLRGEEAGVLGDAHHGKDLGEVRREAEGVDRLAGVRGLDQIGRAACR